MRPLAAAAALSLALLAGESSAAPTPPELVAPAEFDYYVFTLSWSPGFCDTGGEERSPEQCDRENGAGFVVHGLWPNNEDRADPDECHLKSDYVPGEALRLGEQVYPTKALALHEWRAHGTCTGLEAENYFKAVAFARDQFTIPSELRKPQSRTEISPEAIEKAFISANANLTENSMAVTCGRGELIDVRFCLTKDLHAFFVCPKVTGHNCHSRSIEVAPVR